MQQHSQTGFGLALFTFVATLGLVFAVSLAMRRAYARSAEMKMTIAEQARAISFAFELASESVRHRHNSRLATSDVRHEPSMTSLGRNVVPELDCQQEKER